MGEFKTGVSPTSDSFDSPPKRKGTDTRKSGKSIRIPEDAKKKLERYSKSKKIPMSVILATFIDQGVEHDIYDPDWIENVKAVTRAANYLNLDKPCKARTWIIEKEKFICVFGRKGKPPQTKDFPGRDLETIREFCNSCTETLLDKAREAGYENRIKELQDQLEENRAFRYLIPSCKYGATLSNDAKSFTNCRLLSGAVSIEKYCKVRMNGLPCSMYSSHVIAVGDKSDVNLER